MLNFFCVFLFTFFNSAISTNIFYYFSLFLFSFVHFFLLLFIWFDEIVCDEIYSANRAILLLLCSNCSSQPASPQSESFFFVLKIVFSLFVFVFFIFMLFVILCFNAILYKLNKQQTAHRYTIAHIICLLKVSVSLIEFIDFLPPFVAAFGFRVSCRRGAGQKVVKTKFLNKTTNFNTINYVSFGSLYKK